MHWWQPSYHPSCHRVDAVLRQFCAHTRGKHSANFPSTFGEVEPIRRAKQGLRNPGREVFLRIKLGVRLRCDIIAPKPRPG
jgi:hypothetical protein